MAKPWLNPFAGFFSMLNIIKRSCPVWLLLIVSALGAFVPLRAGLANPPVVQAAPAELNRLATGGRLAQLLASLEANPEAAQDPKVASLEQNIKSFEQHREKADRDQAAAYSKAVAH